MTRVELEKLCFEAFPAGKIDGDLFRFGIRGRINLNVFDQLHENCGVSLAEEIKWAIKNHVDLEKRWLETGSFEVPK